MSSSKTFTKAAIFVLGMLLPAVLASCDKALEAPIDDSHPPVLTSIQILNPVLTVYDDLHYAFGYYDAGEDIEIFSYRDKQSLSLHTFSDEAPDNVDKDKWVPFGGVSGSRNVKSLAGSFGRQEGLHTIVCWLKDKKGVYSDPLEVSFYIVPVR